MLCFITYEDGGKFERIVIRKVRSENQAVTLLKKLYPYFVIRFRSGHVYDTFVEDEEFKGWRHKAKVWGNTKEHVRANKKFYRRLLIGSWHREKIY